MNKRFDDTLIGKTVKLWPIIVALLMGAAFLGSFQKTVAEHDKRLLTEEKKSENNDVTHGQLADRISRLEVAVSQLPEMRSDIKQILKEMRRR